MRIVTDRLVLREFVSDDWRAVQTYLADERYWRYYEPANVGDAHEDAANASADDRQRLIDHFINWQEATPRRNYQLAIVLNDQEADAAPAPGDGQLIGNAGLRLRRLFDFGRPEATFEADLGYELDPEFWGQGFATEAVRGLLEFGFGELDLHRVWAYCLAENQPSWRLLQRLGFRLEGTVRENEFMRGRWWDSKLYGLLASEWPPRQG